MTKSNSHQTNTNLSKQFSPVMFHLMSNGKVVFQAAFSRFQLILVEHNFHLYFSQFRSPVITRVPIQIYRQCIVFVLRLLILELCRSRVFGLGQEWKDFVQNSGFKNGKSLQILFKMRMSVCKCNFFYQGKN